MSDHDGDGTDPEPGTGKGGVIPDGYAYTWNVYAYDADAGVAMVLSVDRDGVFDVFEDEAHSCEEEEEEGLSLFGHPCEEEEEEGLSLFEHSCEEEERDHPCGENEEGEEVDFSILKSLPELYIDSDSAMVIASEMGGDDFLDYYSGDEDSEYSEWEVELYALHEYWAFPEQSPSDVPVMWVVRYHGISKDMEGWTEMAEYTIYMDMTTGDTLLTEWAYPEEESYEPEGILFSEAVGMAQAMLDSMDIGATILGGETFYGMGSGEDDYKDEEDDKDEERLFFGDMNRGPSLVMSDHDGDSTDQGSGQGNVSLDGSAYLWNIYAYESTLDSVIAMEIGTEGVMKYYLMGEKDMEGGVDFSIMKPLPENFIDSDQVFTMLVDYGVSNMESLASILISEIPENLQVDVSMGVKIMHDYWNLPFDISPDLIPVTWNMFAHAVAFDSMGTVMMQDSLSAFMNAENGQLIYSNKALTSLEEESLIPEKTVLNQNYPNPFNPSTKITFELSIPQYVQLDVYNTLGQKVLTLVNDRMESGYHSINLDATRLASGVYLYRLIAGNTVFTKKMTLIK